MDLVAKLPSMEDAALAVLRQNAERLEQSGTKEQQSAAAALLPALDAEVESRREAKQAALAAKRTSAKRAPAKRSTAKATAKTTKTATKRAS